ncbi:MAG: TIR domain-containing protein, partial [Methanothrix sp.]|nr:TIR domain-containing protein [Methanothrix sp.]
MRDFFISYNKADRQWAEWIAWQLEQAGYTAIIPCWDFLPGSNFVLEMHEAAKNTKRTIGVLSPRFLSSTFTQSEWSAAFVTDPTGKNRNLLLIRVHECIPDGLLKAISYIDLVDLQEESARTKLCNCKKTIPPISPQDNMERKRLKPASCPVFPGRTDTTPSERCLIWNVLHLRNRNFAGREPFLTGLKAALNSDQSGARIQALTGLGGMGKSSLAREFAYQNVTDYDLVWWVQADEPATLKRDYVSLAKALNLPEKDSPDQEAIVASVRAWLGQNKRWLLIFDNAQEPDVLKGVLPYFNGHVIITSRNPNWANVANVLPLGVFNDAEAVDFLCRRTRQNDKQAAEALAKEGLLA